MIDLRVDKIVHFSGNQHVDLSERVDVQRKVRLERLRIVCKKPKRIRAFALIELLLINHLVFVKDRLHGDIFRSGVVCLTE